MPVLDGGDENVPETSSGDGHTTTIPSNYQEGGLIEHAFYYFPPCYIIQMQSTVLIPGLGAQKERGPYLVLHDSGRRDSKSFVCEQVEMFLSTPPHPRHTHTQLAALGSEWEGGLLVPIHVIQAAFVDGHASTTVFPASFSIRIDSFNSCLLARSSRASPAEQGLWYLKHQFLRELQIGVPKSE